MQKLFFPFLMTLLACLWLTAVWVGKERRNRSTAEMPKAGQMLDAVRRA